MSPRPRKSNPQQLPPCLYFKHGAYWLVKRGTWANLGPDRRAALIEYARRTSPSSGAMSSLIDDAMVEILQGKKPATAKQYRAAGDRLKKMLADFEPAQVTQSDAYAIRRGLRSTPNMANRILTVMRLVFAYAAEAGYVETNPCVGVTRLTERKRIRLLTWDEFASIRNKGSVRLQTMLDLMVATGQRPMDVVRLRLADLRDEGIYFRQQKTDAELIVAWTPDMRDAVRRAKSLHGRLGSLSLYRTRKGTIPAYRTVRDEWDAACAKAGVTDADLRDLRALAGTEAKRQGLNPTALLGHKSALMTERYLREREIPVVQGPSIRRPIDRRTK